jgi:amidase
MEKLTKASVCHTFSRDAEPALRVRAGEAFCLETEDVYGGAIVDSDDKVHRAIRANPATGPVFIEGAQRGDILRVDIERIQVRDYAVMGEPATRVFPMRRDGLHLPGRVRLPLRLMIGLLGVAPRQGVVPTTLAGEHGGNLDCSQMGVGCSVFLPIGCEGALLAAGCVHAAMADGKVAGCGAEVSAEITLRARPVLQPLPTPCVETGDALMFLGSASTLDDCRDLIVEKATAFLTERLDMARDDALVILGLAGDLRICRVDGAQKTMRLVLAKDVLAPLGLQNVAALQRRASEYKP